MKNLTKSPEYNIFKDLLLLFLHTDVLLLECMEGTLRNNCTLFLITTQSMRSLSGNIACTYKENHLLFLE